MEITTDHGRIDSEELIEYGVSEKALDFIKKSIHASEIFFSDKVDLRNYEGDEKFNNEVEEITQIALIENKFSAPARARALSELTGDSLEDIEEINSTQFSIDGADYVVLTDNEADEEALERAKSFFEDMGVENMSEHAKQHVYDNFVHTKWFDDVMEENNRSYAYDIKEEKADNDTYLNRLHEEMVQRDVIPAPEWPEESDFENEDGELDEESYEEARSKYEDEMLDIIEDSIEDFVQTMNEDYDDGVDYFKQTFGDSELADAITEHDLVDDDAVVRWLIDSDGRETYLAPYDNNEEVERVTYRGKDYEFYIYRIS
jgi:hypothetical protein